MKPEHDDYLRMFNIKGFASISTLADNALNTVAPLGELSTNSQTYAREKGHYADPEIGEVVFISFDSRNEDNELEPLPTEYQTATLNMINWLYDQAKLGQIPVNPADLIQNIYNEFGANTVENVELGTMIVDGSIRLPSWIAWSLAEEADGNRIKAWFSDQAFSTEYDQTEIRVIPPVDEIDALFGPFEIVQDLVNSRSVATLMEKIAIERGDDPYTYLKTLTYDRVSITTEDVIPTNWTVLIYGIAGNNPDTIKQAIIDYILANTERTYEEWKALIPELFISTEFIITPFWNNIAIPNETVAGGLYSPIINVVDIEFYAQLTRGEYPQNHTSLVARALQTTYKSIPVVAVGGPENINGENIIDMKFPDYISVPPSSLDANRMSPRTQEWSYLLHALVKAAETMTPVSDVPVNISRLMRGDILYAAAAFDGVQYLVATKWYVSQH